MGDSPLIGSGLYCDFNGAAVATGDGEEVGIKKTIIPSSFFIVVFCCCVMCFLRLILFIDLIKC